jgi:sugar O-acyltransferase (sialic acid O-acetyltransferase NeuD family)
MYIIGAGALGKIVLETAKRAGLYVNGFFDDLMLTQEVDGVPVLGRFEDFQKNEDAVKKGVYIAIGDNPMRKSLTEEFRSLGTHFPNIIDPNAVVSPSAILGDGNLIMPNTYIGHKCSVGSFNLIFPGVSITHHNHVGSYCFFNPNVSVGGFSRIGDCCKIGMNCVVLPYRELSYGFESGPLMMIEGRSIDSEK